MASHNLSLLSALFFFFDCSLPVLCSVCPVVLFCLPNPSSRMWSRLRLSQSEGTRCASRTATHSALALAPKPAHRDSTGRDGQHAGRADADTGTKHTQGDSSVLYCLAWLVAQPLSLCALADPSSLRWIGQIPTLGPLDLCPLVFSSSLSLFSHKGPNLRTCDSRSALRSFPLFPIVPHLYSFPKAVPTPLSRPPSSRPPFLPASARSLVRNTGHRSLCSPHESSASLVSVSLFL